MLNTALIVKEKSNPVAFSNLSAVRSLKYLSVWMTAVFMASLLHRKGGRRQT